VVGGKMLKQVMKITLLYIPKSVRLWGGKKARAAAWEVTR
jgi:hypothetical protein